MILFGGDMVYDGLQADRRAMGQQWVEFNATMRNHNSLPVHYCIGNHDVWGWDTKAVYPNEPEYGKEWVKDTLQLDSTYYSFDRAGWHFVVLDSITRTDHGYIGKLGDAQIDWLRQDLAGHGEKPTLIMSHIPMLAVCPAFFEKSEVDGRRWHVPGRLMHIDARRAKDLFLTHPQVKVCVSGHIHLLDRVDYNGVSYLCNGAICGNWWRGNFQETPPGYALIDLYEDGSWHREYLTYGWHPRQSVQA